MEPMHHKNTPVAGVRVESPIDLYHRMISETAKCGELYNYTAWVSDMRNFVVETDLFSLNVLNFYTAQNMGWEVSELEESVFSTPQRGGKQGFYRNNMSLKIANVVDCLSNFPNSKRAIISIPDEGINHHSDTDAAKCLREVHFYSNSLVNGKSVLNMTVFFRAQAAEIFPKNVHFLGSLLQEVAARTGKNVGGMYYHATRLVSTRES